MVLCEHNNLWMRLNEEQVQVQPWRSVAFLAWLGSGVALLAFLVFPLAFPAFSSGILVGFPSWLAMFVVPAWWLACFAARLSAVSCDCMRARSHVRSLLMPLSVRRVFLLMCFCVPSLPSPSRSSSTDLFSVTGAQGCCHRGKGGGGLVAGVQVGKATGVAYLPVLWLMCSQGGRALRTQPPLETYIKWQIPKAKLNVLP